MAHFVDRRLNPKGKSLGNRRRFIGRVREAVKKSVDDSVRRRSIADVDREEKVTIPAKGLSEPSFQHAAEGGHRERVLSGNKSFRAATGSASRLRAAPESADARGPTMARARTSSCSFCRATSSWNCSSTISNCPTS